MTLEDAAAAIKKVANATLVYPIIADVSSQEQVIALWAEVSRKFNKVDVLINNAGIGGTHTKLGGGKIKEWLEVQVCNPVTRCCSRVSVRSGGTQLTGCTVANQCRRCLSDVRGVYCLTRRGHEQA